MSGAIDIATPFPIFIQYLPKTSKQYMQTDQMPCKQFAFKTPATQSSEREGSHCFAHTANPSASIAMIDSKVSIAEAIITNKCEK
jgi:hypothetical protein